MSQAVIDRSHLIAERFSIPVRDGAIPSYCGRLRGYVSLGPLLDSFDDVDIDRIPGVVGWLHYRLQVPSQSRITFIGYIANNKDVTDLKPGSMVANHALRLQTHTASNFSEPIRVNKTRLFHLGIPIPTGAVTAIFMRIEGYDYPIHVTLHAS